MSDIPKPKLTLFRTCIIYSGKNANRTGAAFVKAKNKEDAKAYIEKLVRTTLKKAGQPEDCFEVKVSESSKDEMDFFVENRATIRSYTGLVN